MLNDLVGIISPFCLLPVVRHRHRLSLKVLSAFQNKIGPGITDLAYKRAKCLRLFPHFHVGGEGSGEGGQEGETTPGQVSGLRLAVLGNQGDRELANGTGLTAPGSAGPPRTQGTSSGSAVPFSETRCRIQGRKARHAPPPLDGTETPRSRFSNCREGEKRQKEYGGGALFLARRPCCAKQGAGHSFFPSAGRLFTPRCGPPALE